jgi:hypothetical protein
MYSTKSPFEKNKVLVKYNVKLGLNLLKLETSFNFYIVFTLCYMGFYWSIVFAFKDYDLVGNRLQLLK